MLGKRGARGLVGGHGARCARSLVLSCASSVGSEERGRGTTDKVGSTMDSNHESSVRARGGTAVYPLRFDDGFWPMD